MEESNYRILAIGLSITRVPSLSDNDKSDLLDFVQNVKKQPDQWENYQKQDLENLFDRNQDFAQVYHEIVNAIESLEDKSILNPTSTELAQAKECFNLLQSGKTDLESRNAGLGTPPSRKNIPTIPNVYSPDDIVEDLVKKPESSKNSKQINWLQRILNLSIFNR